MSTRPPSASRSRAKRGPGRIFLVTDAMATIGTDMTIFTLNGRTIHRKDGRLTLDDGTLAGADLDMISAVRFMHRDDRRSILAKRCAWPRSIRRRRSARRTGSAGFAQGAAANIVALSDELDVRGVWIDGKQVFAADTLPHGVGRTGLQTKNPAGEPAGSFRFTRALLDLVVVARLARLQQLLQVRADLLDLQLAAVRRRADRAARATLALDRHALPPVRLSSGQRSGLLGRSPDTCRVLRHSPRMRLVPRGQTQRPFSSLIWPGSSLHCGGRPCGTRPG